MKDRLICTGYSFMMALILGVCIFGNNVGYSRKIQLICAEPILLAGGILFVGVLATGLRWIIGRIPQNEKMEKKLLLFLSVILLIFQVYCVWNYYFATDWDVKAILDASAAVAHGESQSDFLQGYFSTYPNNLFLVWLYGMLIRFFEWTGIDYRIGIPAFQCVLSWGTGLFLFDTARQITDSRYASWLSWMPIWTAVK